MKSFFYGLVITIVVSLVSLSVDAQTVDTSANASSNTQSSANTQAQNANQQNIQFTSPRNQRIESAPSLGGSSYGTSFSMDGCMNSAGAGLSLVGGAATIGGPKADEVCQSIRMSYAWGQYAKYLRDTGRVEAEAKVVQMIAYDLCTAREKDQKICLELGLVVPQEKK